MPRAFASGQIAFGLVSIPVKLFSAAEASEKISFNMLHQDCGSRVQQQLFCPKDERTIDRSEVVKGYEFSKGQYVLFNEEELKALEEKATQQIDIVEFLPNSQIDPIYFQKANYMAPDRGGDRAYALLAKALEQTGRWALAKYAARGKQYLVVLRPVGKGIVMQQLFYPNEIRSMDELDLGEPVIKDNELKMAVQLAEMGANDEFHPENYRDEVRERVRSLIQKKIEGEEITNAGEEEPRAQVIDLMEALRASLGNGGSKSAKPASAKVPVKAESKRKPAKAAGPRLKGARERHGVLGGHGAGRKFCRFKKDEVRSFRAPQTARNPARRNDDRDQLPSDFSILGFDTLDFRDPSVPDRDRDPRVPRCKNNHANVIHRPRGLRDAGSHRLADSFLRKQGVSSAGAWATRGNAVRVSGPGDPSDGG